MSADNRSTHTDALATLGTILQPGEKRDAIHLGVEPAIAGEELQPGDDVGLNTEGKAVRAWKGANSPVKPIGIVDPFLGCDETVYKNQRFWLIVYPRQITSLRHVWEHPDFPASGETEAAKPVSAEPTPEQLHQTKLIIGEEKAVAQEALYQAARGLGVDYDELMSRAQDYLSNGEYWVEGGRFEGESLPANFWPSYEIVMGVKVPEDDKYSFLSCSC